VNFYIHKRQSGLHRESVKGLLH